MTNLTSFLLNRIAHAMNVSGFRVEELAQAVEEGEARAFARSHVSGSFCACCVLGDVPRGTLFTCPKGCSCHD